MKKTSISKTLLVIIVLGITVSAVVCRAMSSDIVSSLEELDGVIEALPSEAFKHPHQEGVKKKVLHESVAKIIGEVENGKYHNALVHLKVLRHNVEQQLVDPWETLVIEHIDEIILSLKEEMSEHVTIGVTSNQDSVVESTTILAELAFEDINQYCRYNDIMYRFEFEVVSNEGDVSTALENTIYFNENGINLIAGHGWSSMCSACLDYINGNDMLLFSSSSTSPRIAFDDNLYRLTTNDNVQGRIIVDLYESRNVNAVVLLYRDDVWGQGLNDVIISNCEAHGIEVLTSIPFDPEDSDWEDFTENLTSMDDILVSSGYDAEELAFQLISFDEASSVFYALRNGDYEILEEIDWYGSDGTANSQTLIDSVGDQVSLVKLFSTTVAPIYDDPLFIEFRDRYFSASGIDPGFYTADRYDIFWVYALSVINADSTDTELVKAEMEALVQDYHGVSGFSTFNENGDRIGANYDIWGYGWVDGIPRNLRYGFYDLETDSIIWYNITEEDPPARAEFNIRNWMQPGTEGDSLPAGVYNARHTINLQVQNIEDLSETILGEYSLYIEADDIIGVEWEEYADWNNTQATWTFPPDITIPEDESWRTDIELDDNEGVHLECSLDRWMNQTVFEEDGYQEVEFIVNFNDTDFQWVDGNIAAHERWTINASIVPGTFWTDAPLYPWYEGLHCVYFDFDKDLIVVDVDYHFTVKVKVELTGEESPPIEYKPSCEIRYYPDEELAEVGEGYNVEVPPWMLPDDVHSAQASTNTSNTWTIYSCNSTQGSLYEIEELLGPRAEFNLDDRLSPRTDDDSLPAGDYNVPRDIHIHVHNNDDPSDTVLGDLLFHVEADNITYVHWESIADWDQTYATWTYPPDIVFHENQGGGIGFGLGQYEDVYLKCSLDRWMNQTVFEEDGYQEVEFTVNFNDTDFLWAGGHIGVDDHWAINASIVPGTFWTDAPLCSWNEHHLQRIYFDFELEQVNIGVDYHFTVKLKVELTGEEGPPIEYKPAASIDYTVNDERAFKRENYTVEMPSWMLPDGMHAAVASVDSINIWKINSRDTVEGRLCEVITLLGPRAEFRIVESYNPMTNEDILLSGSYHVQREIGLRLRNVDDLSDTTLSDITFHIEADNISDVHGGEYAYWNSTHATWTYPANVVVPENDGCGDNLELSEHQDVFLKCSLERQMNVTIFNEDGYQAVHCTVNFNDTDFRWSDGCIDTYNWDVNTSIVPGTFITDAPLRDIDEGLYWIDFAFDTDRLQTGVDYNFSLIVKVEFTGDVAPPIEYKPHFSVNYNIRNEYAVGGESNGVKVPSWMLPDGVHTAQTSTNASNIWKIYSRLNIEGVLSEVKVLLGPRAEFCLDDQLIPSTDEDSLPAGDYSVQHDISISVHNDDDLSDTVLSDLWFHVEADNITWVDWESIADWDDSHATWTYPPDIVLHEDQGEGLDFGLGEHVDVHLECSLDRWMNQTVFEEDGYQQVEFTINFNDTDTPWQGHIGVGDHWEINASIVPGTFWTDAPIYPWNEHLHGIRFDFDMNQVSIGVDYHFTVKVKVELTGEEIPPIKYKPHISVSYTYNEERASKRENYTVEMPSWMLPDGMHAAVASVDTINIWKINSRDTVEGRLNEVINILD